MQGTFTIYVLYYIIIIILCFEMIYVVGTYRVGSKGSQYVIAICGGIFGNDCSSLLTFRLIVCTRDLSAHIIFLSFNYKTQHIYKRWPNTLHYYIRNGTQ